MSENKSIEQAAEEYGMKNCLACNMNGHQYVHWHHELETAFLAGASAQPPVGGGLEWVKLDYWKSNTPEETNCCLWCKVPIVEPPYCGTLNDEDFPGLKYFTHYLKLENKFFPTSESPTPSASLPVSDDPFIKKHLAIIKEKTLESFIQVKIQHLQRPPLDASVKYFLETGTVNGNFLLAIKDIVYGLPIIIQDELSKQSLPISSDIVSKLADKNPYREGGRNGIGFKFIGFNEAVTTLQTILNEKGKEEGKC